MYSYLKYTFLLESKRIDNLKSKYVDGLNVPQEVFDYWFEHNNNALEWLLKTYVKTENPDYILLSKMTNEFMNNKKNLSVDKISEIEGIDNMRKVLNEIVDYDGYKDRFTEGVGTDNELWVIANTYEYFIYKPYTYETSEEYGNKKGREKNWCTAYDEGYFTKHLGEYGGMLYVINKFDDTKDWALEMDENHITAWNYEDDSKYTRSDLKSLIGFVWKENEEPYKILMENIDKIESDIPSVDWDSARESAEYEMRNMNLPEISEMYGNNIIFRHVNDERFLDDQKDDEIERFQYDWKYESNLDEKLTEILEKDFQEWTSENKKAFFDYFIPKMQEYNEENESDDYDVTNPTLDGVLAYMNDNYSDYEEIIRDLGLVDEIVELLADESMSNFDDAEDYFLNMYGRNLNSEELSQLDNYVDMEALAKDIVKDMDTEELKNYL